MFQRILICDISVFPSNEACSSPFSSIQVHVEHQSKTSYSEYVIVPSSSSKSIISLVVVTLYTNGPIFSRVGKVSIPSSRFSRLVILFAKYALSLDDTSQSGSSQSVNSSLSSANISCTPSATPSETIPDTTVKFNNGSNSPIITQATAIFFVLNGPSSSLIHAPSLLLRVLLYA